MVIIGSSGYVHFPTRAKAVIYLITQSKNIEYDSEVPAYQKNGDKGKYVRTEQLHKMPWDYIHGMYQSAAGKQERELLTVLKGIRETSERRWH